MKDAIIIGAGNKARHGKDTFAEIVQANYEGVFITHWAKQLYTECQNAERRFPLIKSHKGDKRTCYSILSGTIPISGFIRPVYDVLEDYMVPQLHKIFTERNITEYAGMDEKDSLILQFWGTGFRRAYYGEDYWVNQTVKEIERISHTPEFARADRPVIILPDTRFKNEYNTLTNELNGHYVRIKRLNADGSIFVDPSRDPLHQSEVELDGVATYREIVVKTGEIPLIEAAAHEIMESFNAVRRLPNAA